MGHRNSWTIIFDTEIDIDSLNIIGKKDKQSNQIQHLAWYVHTDTDLPRNMIFARIRELLVALILFLVIYMNVCMYI